MLDKFLSEFEQASIARDEANTSRYFKLFPMIGHEEAGLEAYAKFVCSIISSRSKTAGAAQPTSPLFFSSLLTPLLEQIALIISQHQPVVEKYYGRGKMLPVAERLQEECDRQALATLMQWEEERRIIKHLQDARSHKFAYLTSIISAAAAAAASSSFAATPINIQALNASFRQVTQQRPAGAITPVIPEEDAVDPREIDAVLSELAQISGRWELYRRFLYDRLVSLGYL